MITLRERLCHFCTGVFGMKIDNEIPSKRVLCCEARTWAFAIGWLQSILSVLGFIPTILSFTYLKQLVRELSADEEVKNNEEKGQEVRIFHAVGITLLILRCVCMLTLLFAGIALIRGIREQNLRKFNIWCVVQIVFIILTTVAVGSSLYSGGLVGAVAETFTLAVTILCFWLVYTHRQELVTANERATRAAQKQTNYARRQV